MDDANEHCEVVVTNIQAHQYIIGLSLVPADDAEDYIIYLSTIL